MYRIKHAVDMTGVAAGTLRAWEQRYGIGSPHRSESGYRLYDDAAIAEIRGMQQLIASGWSSAEAAVEILHRRGIHDEGTPSTLPQEQLVRAFIEAARSLDDEQMNAVLDEAFASGSFESIIDGWLVTALRRLGDEWVAGRMSIPAEHFASNAIMRRLGAFFDAAASLGATERVLIGTPTGAMHEIGSLALAAAIRRRGISVTYLGVDIPAASWVEAAQRHRATAAIISVPMSSDVAAAQQAVDALRNGDSPLLVAVGGPAAPAVVGADQVLAGAFAESAKTIAQIVRKRASRAH